MILNTNTNFQDFVHADDRVLPCEVQDEDGLNDEMDTNTDGKDDDPTVATVEECSQHAMKQHITWRVTTIF
jgi:hypothetical protein